MRILLTLALSALLCQPLWAQGGTGQVDFNSLTSIYGEPRVMINLGGPLMKIISAAAAEDPQAAAILQDLDGIKVNIYNTDGNTDPALDQLKQAKAALEAAQWQPIVQVKEQGENVQMFAQVEGDMMQGMAIMVVNEEEAVFINILGQINPAEVGKVIEHLNVEVDGQ